jgi:hypothetical protein
MYYAQTIMVIVHSKLKENVLNVRATKVETCSQWLRFMVFNATFNNISVISWSVLLVEETGKNQRPAARH